MTQSRTEESTFWELAEATPHLVWVAGPDGQLEYFNERWCAYTGLAREQCPGWGWQSAIHADDLKSCRDNWQLALDSGQPYESNYRLKRADGQYRWHTARAGPVRGADGKIVRWFGTVTDIHEERRATELLKQHIEQRDEIEKALMEQRALFDSFMQHLPLAAFMKDESGRIIYGNQALDEITATKLKYQLNRLPGDFLPPDLAAEIEANDLLVRQTNQAMEFVERYPDENSVIAPWLVFKFPFTDASGKRYVGGIAAKHTERQRIQDELLKATLEYETIFNSVHAIIFYKDTDNRIIRLNKRAAEFFGKPAEELIGKHVSEVFPLSAQHRHQKDLEIVATGKPVLGVVETLTELKGKRITVKTDRLPYYSPEGQPIGVIVVSTDISEIRRLTDQREDMMHAVAHDMKVPVIGAQRALNVLLEGMLGDLTEAQKTFLQKLVESNARLLEMIQNLIEVYKYEQSGPALAFLQLDWVKLTRECLNQLDFLVKERKLDLRTRLPRRLTIEADHLAVHRLLMNLLGNAIKFTPEDGKIEVHLERANQQAKLSIKNSGNPIPRDDQKRLFQRFYRGLDSQRYGAGSGMGLYLCRQIVEAHQGEISCSSDLKEGTIFCVTLPVRHVSEVQSD